ncbi:MAG TPA: GNAT family N-acetyltransferase [Blastocatellia bacterium]|nr:GNAT family N-acetyltransferase [Blastocatellia bacterium]
MMTIRHAEPEEAARLTEIAIAAKRHWGYPESWIETWRDELTITPDFIERHQVFAITDNAIPMGFYAVVTSGDSTKLEHMWILPELIGNGLGRQLLKHAHYRAAMAGVKVIEIVSDPNAEGFYLKAGAKKIGEVISTIQGQKRKLPLLALDILDIFEIGDIPK